MKQGKDYIIFALDVPSADRARRLAAQLNGAVGLFKIGLELFIQCGPELVHWIRRHTDAGIFLDLKLHDIPATVERAMRVIAGLEVDLTTVHCGESQSMLDAAVTGSMGKVDVLGVTVLTSVTAADLRTAGYADDLVGDLRGFVLQKASMAYNAGCAGIVCSGLEVEHVKARFGDGFLAVTPGIRPDAKREQTDDQQRIVTPAMAVSKGADFIVVGRPIRDAADPGAAAGRIAAEIDNAL